MHADEYKKCVEKQEEIKGLQRKIIKIDLGSQEIKNELTNIKMSNTMIMENLKKLYYNNRKIHESWKISYNKFNHNLIHRIR